MLFLIILTFSFDSSKKNINFEAAKAITSFKKLNKEQTILKIDAQKMEEFKKKNGSDMNDKEIVFVILPVRN